MGRPHRNGYAGRAHPQRIYLIIVNTRFFPSSMEEMT